MEILNKIQQELKAPKAQRNTFGNYNYRSCEDILEAVKPLLGKATLTIADEIVMLGDRFYVKATATITEYSDPHDHPYVCEITKYLKGETSNKEIPPCTCGKDKQTKSVSVSAFARESLDKKGMDAAQITGATSSYARKYALNGLFCIDDTKDADTQDNSTNGAVTTKNVTTSRIEPHKATPKADKPVKKVAVTPEMAEQAAKGAIENADTLEKVQEVQKQINKSPYLSDGMKADLVDMCITKITTFNPLT